MPTTERFFTANIDPSERLAYWNRLTCETYAELTVVPRPGSEFGGALVRRSYGGVWLTQVTTTPATVRGDSWEGSPRDPEHAFVLLLESGTSEHVVDGKRVRLEPGALTLNLSSRPYSIDFDETTRFFILKVPVPRLAARLGNLRRITGRRAEARDTALLSNFLRTLLGRGEAAGDVEHELGCDESGWDKAIGDVIFDLVTIAYHRVVSPPTSHSAVNDRWQRSVRDFVDRHLDDPELGAPLIAQRLGVTPRYVQMVFASMATTASAYIVGRRLELAARLLASGPTPVTDVALRAGFADLSYFYRSFRKRYGISPRRYAAAH